MVIQSADLMVATMARRVAALMERTAVALMVD
jgi:hypothetical protein